MNLNTIREIVDPYQPTAYISTNLEVDAEKAAYKSASLSC